PPTHCGRMAGQRYRRSHALELSKVTVSVHRLRRIGILRQHIGHKHLMYALYSPWESGGIRVATSPRTESIRWADFMADWATGGIKDDGGPGSRAHWLRNALLDANEEANAFIAEALGTSIQGWKPYSPAFIDIEVDYPAYSLDHRPKYTPHVPSGGMMSGDNDV
ncbi:hypothetical protein, partial [Rhizobium sullae]|uniref:hypothetical protein n=1 Tax=Rhizobium sullae TaxID=50338 RepID=UPI001A9ECBEC